MGLVRLKLSADTMLRAGNLPAKEERIDEESYGAQCAMRLRHCNVSVCTR